MRRPRLSVSLSSRDGKKLKAKVEPRPDALSSDVTAVRQAAGQSDKVSVRFNRVI